jgi:hypothetical protein
MNFMIESLRVSDMVSLADDQPSTIYRTPGPRIDMRAKKPTRPKEMATKSTKGTKIAELERGRALAFASFAFFVANLLDDRPP